MKEKDALINNDQQPIIVFVEKDDNTYGPMLSGSLAARDHLDDFFLKKRNTERDLIGRMMDGKITPVFYYMTMVELSAAELASRVGIRTIRVKKHFRPQHFSRIRLSLLKRYADVFGIPVANLLQVVYVQQDENGKGYKTLLLKEKDFEKVSVTQSGTDNPMLSIMKIKEVN